MIFLKNGIFSITRYFATSLVLVLGLWICGYQGNYRFNLVLLSCFQLCWTANQFQDRLSSRFTHNKLLHIDEPKLWKIFVIHITKWKRHYCASTHWHPTRDLIYVLRFCSFVLNISSVHCIQSEPVFYLLTSVLTFLLNMLVDTSRSILHPSNPNVIYVTILHTTVRLLRWYENLCNTSSRWQCGAPNCQHQQSWQLSGVFCCCCLSWYPEQEIS